MTRWRAVAISAIVAVVGTLAIPAAHATATFRFGRLAGNDRYETAAAVAQQLAGGTSAILATGEDFPDALAAAYLAGARSAPVLLTARDSLPAATATALDDIGATSVTLLGGASAISDAVASELAAAGLEVDRIAGADRFETARLTAEAVGVDAVGTPGGIRTAIVASGASFADATAAGPLAHAGGLPILLTSSDDLHPATVAALDALDIEQALVLGGPAAVSAGAETDLESRGIDVVRLAGADRTATAAAIATYAIETLAFPATNVNLARGDAFADALAGGPYGGSKQAVTLLTVSPTSLGSATSAWLEAHEETLQSGTILGGSSAVSQAVEAAATTAAGGDGAAVGAAGVQPSVAITGGLSDGAVTSNTKPTYSGTAAADGGVVRRVTVSLDDGDASTNGVTCTGCDTDDATWTYSPDPALTDGVHTIEVRAVGADGARSVPDTTSVTVDTTQPAFTAVAGTRGLNRVTTTFSEPVWCASARPADFTATVAAASTAVTDVRCPSATTAQVELVIARVLAAGDQLVVTLVGTVSDPAGNVAPGASQSSTVENTDAPTITLTSGPPDGGWSRTRTPHFGGGAAAPSGRLVTSVQARIGDASFNATGVSCGDCPDASVTWAYVAPTLADGPYTFDFRSVDDGGVISTVTRRIVTVDATAPTFGSIAAKAGDAVVQATFTEANGIACSSVAATDFTATIANTAVQVVSVSCAPPTASPQHVLGVTLAAAPAAGQNVALTLKVESVADPAGNYAPSRMNTAVAAP